MEKADIPVVKRSLFSWVFPGNVKLQILLLFIIVVMVFARVLPLEMQKRIVNCIAVSIWLRLFFSVRLNT